MPVQFSDVDAETRAQSIKAVFAAFVAALRDGDYGSYVGLHHSSAQPELSESVFLQNVQNAQDHQLEFSIESMILEGNAATLAIDVHATDGQQQHNDRFELGLVYADNKYWIVQA